MIICVECGKEMTELYQGQAWCEECHTKFHEECKISGYREDCFNCDSQIDCWDGN